MKHIKKKLLILAIPPLVSIVLATIFYTASSPPRIINTYISPDKEFALEVWGDRQFAHYPGDRFSSSGFVIIRSNKGEMVEKFNIELVSSVDKVMWSDEEVIIAGVRICKLPRN